MALFDQAAASGLVRRSEAVVQPESRGGVLFRGSNAALSWVCSGLRGRGGGSKSPPLPSVAPGIDASKREGSLTVTLLHVEGEQEGRSYKAELRLPVRLYGLTAEFLRACWFGDLNAVYDRTAFLARLRESAGTMEGNADARLRRLRACSDLVAALDTCDGQTLKQRWLAFEQTVWPPWKAGRDRPSSNHWMTGARITELITQLMEAREERTLTRLKGQLSKLDLLVLDELGYVPTSKLGAELLFDVISTAYERTSLIIIIIITTNLPFEQWVEVLGSERLTGAALDRLAPPAGSASLATLASLRPPAGHPGACVVR